MQNQKVEIRKFIRSLPQSSGVYLMKDRLGHVIYVGKAKNLKRRVSSYFQGSRRFVRAQPKIAAMVEMVCEISIHETKNETEALLLEGKLIKEYKPRYNTDFTDDKQFLMDKIIEGEKELMQIAVSEGGMCDDDCLFRGLKFDGSITAQRTAQRICRET